MIHPALLKNAACGPTIGFYLSGDTEFFYIENEIDYIVNSKILKKCNAYNVLYNKMFSEKIYEYLLLKQDLRIAEFASTMKKSAMTVQEVEKAVRVFGKAVSDLKPAKKRRNRAKSKLNHYEKNNHRHY
jgi:hypothetical protein